MGEIKTTLFCYLLEREEWRQCIILVENPARTCFLLRDLIPITFFKKVMPVKLRIRATVNIFGKICI